MAAGDPISDLSDYVHLCTGGSSGTPEHLFVTKSARVAGAAATATIAGRPHSLFLYDGSPSAGVAPTTVANPTNATNGTLKQTNPGGGRTKWLLGASMVALVAGTVVHCDRLLEIGGLVGNVNTAQTVGGTLSRFSTGATCVGNKAYVEIYGIIGTTGTTVTMSYQNQANATKTSTAVVIGGTGFREVSRMIEMPLAAGDTGILAVNSITIAAVGGTGTAGNIGVTIARPLLIQPIGQAGAGSVRNLIREPGGPIAVPSNAALAMMWIANTTTAPELNGSVHFVEK